MMVAPDRDLPALARPGGLGRASHVAEAMGGRLGIHVAHRAGDRAAADHDAVLAAARVIAWSRLLTRHLDDGPLARLNDDPRARVPVPPTLAAALAWAADAGRLTGGIVDVTRLDDRLRAEGSPVPGPSVEHAWRLVSAGSREHTMERAPGLRFDLDGIGKGWLADRALDLLAAHPGAAVDADGDVAIRVASGGPWEIGVADPRDDSLLAVVVLGVDGPAARCTPGSRWGVATSGTTVHRFGARSHHLIDPRTGEPAETDVVQATVIASGAAVAEVLAKSAVILGAAAGLELLYRSGAAGAILLLEDGRVLALPRTTELLA